MEVVDFHRPESITLWDRFINQNAVKQFSVPRMIYVGTEFDQHVELAIIDIQDSLVISPSTLSEGIRITPTQALQEGASDRVFVDPDIDISRKRIQKL
ncbi:hypothetical protein IPC95_16525 [Pseudomonas aeruginosa]|nr:hypothetical protein IPC95_16525 [Pseudomonas aeruginosa]